MGSVTKLPSYGNSQFIRKIITFLLRLKGIKKAQKTAYMTKSIQYINICAVLNHFTSRQFLLEFRCNSSWTMISHIKHANWKKNFIIKYWIVKLCVYLNCSISAFSPREQLRQGKKHIQKSVYFSGRTTQGVGRVYPPDH